MIGHLGARVSALLDGQLSPRETEEAWAHVYACHPCRDLVEREGWVKAQLAGLSGATAPTSAELNASLLSVTPGERYLADRGSVLGRRGVGVAAVGGGAVGMALLGVLALGAAPAQVPPAERRPPASRIDIPLLPEPTVEPTSAVRDLR